ncbi:hypothetical protein Tco_0531863 [Tanacetum coccineum]
MDPTQNRRIIPKDNPKRYEIAVLSMIGALKNEKKCMDKGTKESSHPHNVADRKRLVNTLCCQNHKLIACIEDDIHGPHECNAQPLPSIRVGTLCSKPMRLNQNALTYESRAKRSI